jgi:Fibronectin type III domain
MSDDTSAPIPGSPPQPQQQPPGIAAQPPPMPWPPQPKQQGGQVPPTQSIAPQPGLPPPPVPSSAEVGRRRRPPLWALLAGGVALVGLVVGLLVWAPWSPRPQAPTAVHVSSPTATTALVSWAAPKGGATPDQYDIMRDGKEQGIVPGSRTSWTDTGLAPGGKYSYTVITVGNGQKSGPSATTPVTTITPPPVVTVTRGRPAMCSTATAPASTPM